jgi:hypothetical protein
MKGSAAGRRIWPNWLKVGRSWPWSRWTVPARVTLVLAVILTGAQCRLLYSRASQERSDVGVMIRSATLLNEGAGAELYEDADEVTGWNRAHPPAALALFQPLVRLGPRGAAIGWVLANIGFLLLSLWSLRRLISTLGASGRVYEDALPWLATLLLVLAAGSIQVGQFSLLFLSCWMVALDGLARQKDFVAGVAFAPPIAIKIYPALLLGTLGVLKPKRMATVLSFLLVGGLGFAVLIPFLSVGERTGSLTASWVTNSLFSTGGRVSSYFVGPGAISTQSLESLLSRFLTGGSAFHAAHPHVPHLNLDPTFVLGLAAIISLAILSASVWATGRLRQAPIEMPLKLLYSGALWSATLYAVLPETKARYAAYTFLAFVPLLAQITWARSGGDGKGVFRAGVVLGVSLIMIVQMLPRSIQVLGIGYLGSLILWGWNFRWAWSQNGSERHPPHQLG